ncbi:hypothetical protein A4R26_24730 [Niastella populi]|uniref:Uncharacterized protein n=1 Tax=Niastella populi TaxID=550983 RepID=A0A1V9FGM0_9BACT|nr:hypothetical protein A4R26_24730 [Niastella populi]
MSNAERKYLIFQAYFVFKYLAIGGKHTKTLNVDSFPSEAIRVKRFLVVQLFSCSVAGVPTPTSSG